MFTIGCHLSVTKGFYHMARTATELGANTFQFFPRNPRGGAAKPLAKEDIRQLEEWMDTHGFGEILCHGAYTMNGASTKEEVREFARTALSGKIWQRCPFCRGVFIISIPAPI